MKFAKKEFILGIFIILGLSCIGYLTIKLGRMDIFQPNSYTLKAYFNSITGLRNGASVQIAGVEVGRVINISLDNNTAMAIVELSIHNDVLLSDDTMASVKTSGLIGDKYIGLTPGGSTTDLMENDTIFDTQSSMDIEELIGKYLFGDV